MIVAHLLSRFWDHQMKKILPTNKMLNHGRSQTTQLQNSLTSDASRLGRLQRIGKAENEGYISDVQSNGLGSESDNSNVLTCTVQNFEKQFRTKYKYLQIAYEERIHQLKDSIQEALSNLISDDVLSEMRKDGTSAAFIPSHIGEIIDSHLKNETENFAHTMICKVSDLEFQLHVINEKNKALHSKLRDMESVISHGAKIEKRYHQLKDEFKQAENSLFESSNRFKTEIGLLEKSNVELNTNLTELIKKTKHDAEISTRVFKNYEMLAEKEEKMREFVDDCSREAHVFQRERESNTQLLENLQNATVERNTFKLELEELRRKYRYVREELERAQHVFQSRVDDENQNRSRMTLVMAQVEKMLKLEASESSAAVKKVLDRSKSLKARLMQQIEHEKLVNNSLQEELFNSNKKIDDLKKDCDLLKNENLRLNHQVSMEERQKEELVRKLNDSMSIQMSLKKDSMESEIRAQEVEGRLKQIESMKEKELFFVEEKTKFETEKFLEMEKSIFENKSKNDTHYPLSFNDTMATWLPEGIYHKIYSPYCTLKITSN